MRRENREKIEPQQPQHDAVHSIVVSAMTSPAISLYPLENYKFGEKNTVAKPDDDEKMTQKEEAYKREGLRRNCEGVCLVHEHGHPHVLLLRVVNSETFKLPGGRLQPGYADDDGLKIKLTNKLAPEDPAQAPQWEIGELLGVWWRPNFDELEFPYVPAHITKPKECTKVYLIHLPQDSTFAVPKNYKLVAVPLFELYNNQTAYGPLIGSIPSLLARFTLNLIGAPEAAIERPMTTMADKSKGTASVDGTARSLGSQSPPLSPTTGTRRSVSPDRAASPSTMKTSPPGTVATGAGGST